MKYFKNKQWQKKSDFQKLVDAFQAEGKKYQSNSSNLLALTREYAEAWPDICQRPDIFQETQIEEYKKLMIETVEKEWGPCNFDFDMNQAKIFVTSKDGRAIELVSASVISDGVMTKLPALEDYSSPAEYSTYVQGMENAINDFFEWEKNTENTLFHIQK